MQQSYDNWKRSICYSAEPLVPKLNKRTNVQEENPNKTDVNEIFYSSKDSFWNQ